MNILIPTWTQFNLPAICFQWSHLHFREDRNIHSTPCCHGHLPILTFSDVPVHKSNPDLKGAKGKRGLPKIWRSSQVKRYNLYKWPYFFRFHCENFTQLNQGCKPPKSRNGATPIIHPNPPPTKMGITRVPKHLGCTCFIPNLRGGQICHISSTLLVLPDGPRCTPPGIQVRYMGPG